MVRHYWVFITGLTILLILSRFDQFMIDKHNNLNQISVPASFTEASISKGTIMLLLAVGIVGALGASRKKKGSGSHIQNYGGTVAKKYRDRK